MDVAPGEKVEKELMSFRQTEGEGGASTTSTYPTKYKRLRVALPRQALRGYHSAIRTNEGLGIAAARCTEAA